MDQCTHRHTSWVIVHQPIHDEYVKCNGCGVILRPDTPPDALREAVEKMLLALEKSKVLTMGPSMETQDAVVLDILDAIRNGQAALAAAPAPGLTEDDNRRLRMYKGMLTGISLRSDVPQELRDKIKAALPGENTPASAGKQ